MAKKITKKQTKKVKPVKKENKEIVKINKSETANIEPEKVTKELILNYAETFLNKQLTALELRQFMEIAVAFNLNPFKREIYCIPYGQGEYRRLSIITGYETYLKRAYATKMIEHWQTDIGKDDIGEYAIIIIKRKDWSGIFQHKVYMKEYNDGHALWKTKPYTMLKKVVTAQGFRLCFPEEFEGMPYTNDELPDEMTVKEINPDKKEENEAILKQISDSIAKIDEAIEPKWNVKEAKDKILSIMRPIRKYLTKEQEQNITNILMNTKYTEKQFNEDIIYIQELEKTIKESKDKIDGQE